MATPILDIVPSYDVNNGVTLTFNSNYGTNLIRGSQVVIRDQNQNVIARHTYIPNTYNEASTRHIIPSKQALLNESVAPNAWDGDTVTYPVDAIVTYNNDTYCCIKATTLGILPTDEEYWVKVATGEATLSYVSSDFNTKYVNEAQLQFSITVFVGYTISNYIVSFVGESFNSNIRSAWALPNATVTFDAIPASIDTTSYTLGLTYNTNQTSSAGRVYAPPQSMEFTLYSLNDTEWEQVGDTNFIYNSGSRLNDTLYYANYSLYSLANGNKYKVRVKINSLLGMTTQAETPPFTVNATTYQISSFEVINDSCNGKVDIVSRIVDVSGESNVTPENSELDLSNDGDYCTWNQGLGFTNNWTSRFWGYDFHVTDDVNDPTQAILHFESDVTGGVIDGYMVEDPNGYRFDLFIYPSGYGGVSSYFQSNVVDNLGTQVNPLCILIGFDYDNFGTYYVRILTS